MRSINPFNGELVAEYPAHSEAEVDARIETSHRAFDKWRRTNFAERAEAMLRAGEILEKRKDELARLMAIEMGKPVAAGRAESEKCAWVCRYFAEEAEGMLADQPISTDNSKSYIHHEALGVVLAVMPWNFPFWQVFRFIAPAFMAGNAAVLKHASNVSGCSLEIEEILNEAGFPEGLFASLLIPSERVARVLEDSRVVAATLTGSESAGRAVASKAGSLLKKTVLELGGSDPYLILADADIEEAATICAASRMINNGQSCIAAKRFIVVERVASEFIEAFVEEMKSFDMGDPLDDSTRLGPLARRDLRDDLHDLVEQSISAGAEPSIGGKVPDGLGAFYPPTVLIGVQRGMPVYAEETFGPVASIISVPSEDEAVRVANDTRFGLGSAIFSRDLERAEHLAATRLEAGCCFVNRLVASDPRLPFGGVKASGYGRELSALGMKEFVNEKTVVLA